MTFALLLAMVIAYLVSLSHLGFSTLWHGPSHATIVQAGAIPYELAHLGRYCALAHGRVHCGLHHRPSGQWPALLTALSAMFLHADLLHLAGDALFLFLFGPVVEDRLGRVRYPIFFVLGGLVALALQVVLAPHSTAPAVGASGAIAAVVAGALVLAPRVRIVTVLMMIMLGTILEIPGILLAVLWLGEQIAYAATGLTDPIGHGWVAY
ncbi:MAG TPA: rhomboid family intramembrane serine protease, partial [Solirubrobacteraceae bacterium]|nr:rhomboid family intramembrane serine protease [Solirubrobacteraceae bacterium]